MSSWTADAWFLNVDFTIKTGELNGDLSGVSSELAILIRRDLISTIGYNRAIWIWSTKGRLTAVDGYFLKEITFRNGFKWCCHHAGIEPTILWRQSGDFRLIVSSHACGWETHSCWVRFNRPFLDQNIMNIPLKKMDDMAWSLVPPITVTEMWVEVKKTCPQKQFQFSEFARSCESKSTLFSVASK